MKPSPSDPRSAILWRASLWSAFLSVALMFASRALLATPIPPEGWRARLLSLVDLATGTAVLVAFIAGIASRVMRPPGQKPSRWGRAVRGLAQIWLVTLVVPFLAFLVYALVFYFGGGRL